MKSYYEHLQTLAGHKAKTKTAKPVFRASALFPVIEDGNFHTRILYMGYWLLKRGAEKISQICTLRTQQGKIIFRKYSLISDPRAFTLEAQTLLEQSQIEASAPFYGSLEVEFFSSTPLVFPFPALVLNYYGQDFSSLVHTAQRTYNDNEDREANSETQVPEAGFNIYSDSNTEPFICIINGMLPQEKQSIRLTFYNSKGEALECKLEQGPLRPFETLFLYPARSENLTSFLEGSPGTAKIRFQVQWAYPRLIAGNLRKEPPAAAITHTYYDTSSFDRTTDYWESLSNSWHPAALIVPLICDGNRWTKVYFYPIYSPASFEIDVEIRCAKGKTLGVWRSALTFNSSSGPYRSLSLKQFCEQQGIETKEPLAARIIAKTITGNPIPARIKIGLDIGSFPENLPCNICTNLQPCNPDLDNKPGAFRWAPLLDTLWIMNSSPAKEYNRDAATEITLFREQDNKTATRKIIVRPNGFAILHRKEFDTFFNEGIGWAAVKTDNPYVITYYFQESKSGMIAGDHGF